MLEANVFRQASLGTLTPAATVLAGRIRHETWVGLSRWLHLYNHRRQHQSLGYLTPVHVYRVHGQVALAA